MDPTIVEAILQDRKIAYAIADRHFNVVALGGATELISPARLRGDRTLVRGRCMPEKRYFFREACRCTPGRLV